MKKIITIAFLFIYILFNLNYVSAYSREYKCELNLYTQEIEKINQKYNTNYYILDENDFLNSELKEKFSSNYKQYIKFITTQDIGSFKKSLIDELVYTSENVINTKIWINSRSTIGSKTMLFFNGNNKMTLKYKYSGSKFDTSYKPIVTVSRVSSIMFFEMSSYSGQFLNSNKTYRVIAKGRVITTTGIANNKSYTVNFNL